MPRPVSLVLAVTLGAAALASAARGALAQTPPAGASPSAPPSGTPTPAYAPGPLTIDATIRLPVSPEGLYQVIPEGTKIQVATNAGVCVEITLPAADVQALNATKELTGLTIDVAERGAAAGAAGANCPAPGDLITIALAYPNGSYTPLATGPYNGGTVSAEFVVPAPGPISEGAQLPRTGAGGGGAIEMGYVGVALLLAGIGAFGASRLVALRRR